MRHILKNNNGLTNKRQPILLYIYNRNRRGYITAPKILVNIIREQELNKLILFFIGESSELADYLFFNWSEFRYS